MCHGAWLRMRAESGRTANADMSDPEQTAAFEKEVNAVVNRFRAEFNITIAAAVGTLAVISHQLIAEALEKSE